MTELLQSPQTLPIYYTDQGADELILEKAKVVWGRVGDGDLADPVLVEGNQRRASCQVSMAGRRDRGHRHGERGQLSRVQLRPELQFRHLKSKILEPSSTITSLFSSLTSFKSSFSNPPFTVISS